MNDEKPGVVNMVDASTGHLTPADFKALAMAARVGYRENGFPRVVVHEYGFTIFLSGDAPAQVDEVKASYALDCSYGFRRLLQYGHANKAYVVNLDQGADPIPGIDMEDAG